MGLTSLFLRQWMEGRRKKIRAQFEQPVAPTISLADLPAAGARWRRNPDGTWMRWSYLGETWEAQTATPALIEAAESKPAVDTWILTDGVWQPFDPDAKPADQPAQASEQLPPAQDQTAPPQAAQPKVDPDLVERPEWTADWNPGWNQEPK